MREILFKAKRIDNGEWVEGCLITRKYAHTDEVYEAHIVEDAYEQLGVLGFGIHPVLISPLADKYVDGCFRVDINTICQYTGLTDKNGNKIWENDVVKKHFYTDYDAYTNSEEYTGKVEYLDFAWCITFEENKHKCVYPIFMAVEFKDAEYYEVIGNIFDNPELLKGSEKE